MLQVESCIELYCYAGCVLSSKQMPRGTTRSPPAPGPRTVGSQMFANSHYFTRVILAGFGRRRNFS